MIGSPITVGTQPAGIAVDGANLWVANNGSGTVSKIDPTTAAVQATVTVGNHPYGVAFDGTDVWVTNSYFPSTLSKIDPTTDTVIGTGGDGLVAPAGLVFDGREHVGHQPRKQYRHEAARFVKRNGPSARMRVERKLTRG